MDTRVTSLVRWDLQRHQYKKQLKLDKTYENADPPSNITVALFEPQKKALAAMWRLEQSGGVVVNSLPYDYGTHIEDLESWKTDPVIFNTKIQTHMGVLSNPLGSGKTLVALSLIALSSLPPARPIPITIPDRKATLSNYTYISNSGQVREKFAEAIRITHHREMTPCVNLLVRKRIDRMLKPALVFSGRPALRQWLHAVNAQTNMKAFIIENAYHLKAFRQLLDDDSINDYDVIIVKNGKFSGTTIFPDIMQECTTEGINSLKNHDFYNVICNITRNMCFSRVFIDDFDQIGLPSLMGHINALFTWFISCTVEYYPGGSSACNNYNVLLSSENVPSIESYMYQTYIKYKDIVRNDVLFSNFNICCTNELVKDTMNIGKPTFYTYTIKNPNNHLIAALGAMGDHNVTEIFEMLNGDAIDDAAEKAGIASMNTKDIFQKILADKYESWEKARKILQFIKVENTISAHNARQPIDRNPDKEDTYGKLHLRAIRPILYKYPQLHRIFEEESGHWTVIKAKNGKNIERVQNNLQTSVCAICCCSLTGNIAAEEDDEFDDFGDFMIDIDQEILHDDEQSKSVVMMKCCGVTLCAGCGMRGSNFRRTRYYKNKSHNGEYIVGLCANCKIEIIFDDLIFINKDFDHDQILLENIEVDEGAPEPIIKKEPEEVKERDKIHVLIDIINGKCPPERKDLHKSIPNLMIGTANLPAAAANDIKVLVFANYDGSLLKTAKRLDEQKIEYGRLGGTSADIYNMSIEFNEKNLNVLLINSIKYCASLNLQSATDVVFMHKILDNDIESQVSGRAQRIGRKHHLNIHYILYDNERAYL